MTKRKRQKEKVNNISPTKAIYKLLTEGQEDYWECLDYYSILFCNGPAGSGKTYLMVLKAIDMLLKDEVERIIICRPPVGTTRKGIGFLPGDMYAKLDLYMKPVIEEICKVLGGSVKEEKRGLELYRKAVTDGKISIESLDHIRGKNFHNTFMCLDEAENCTKKQIDGFVSRAGQNSKVVLCGDANQTDLLERKQVVIDNKVIWREYYNCDFFDICNKIYIADDDDIGMCELTEEDIVRSPILKKYLQITG